MEVLFGDGAAGEVGGEDALDFGEGVEPGEEARVRLGVVEAAVELLAEVAGEGSDFAVHSLIFLFRITERVGQKLSMSEK